MGRILVAFLLLATLALPAQDDVLLRNVFGVNPEPKCDTVSVNKISCADTDCKPKLQVPLARGIKDVMVYSLPGNANIFPVVEDYYYNSIDSAKMSFNRLYFFAEAFNVTVTAKTRLVTELQIAVFYRQRKLVRIIKLADAETAKADKICRVLSATYGVFYIAANFKEPRYLKVKGG